jgi:hypothetical protein
VQFNGDMLAFGTEEGDLYIISMSTADVINAYEGHDGQCTRSTNVLLRSVYDSVYAS